MKKALFALIVATGIVVATSQTVMAGGAPILADGLYKAKSDYYWVANGTKVKLPKNKEFSTITKHVVARDMVYKGVSEKDFGAMMTICERYGGDYSIYVSCMKERQRGIDMRAQLKGKIIMRSELDGSLFYIANNEDNSIVALSGFEDAKSFRKEVLRKYSIGVKKSIIKQLLGA